jgi:ABC-2 type transport system ATP-binding protein
MNKQNTAPLVQMSSVSKTFGSHRVLDGLDWQVAPGQVIERGTTVVFSTHILSDLERVAFDLAFLKDGRIALQGQLDALLDGARRIVAPPHVLPPEALDGEVRRSCEGALTSVVVQTACAQLAQLAARPGVRVESMTLEDLFIEVTREVEQ